MAAGGAGTVQLYAAVGPELTHYAVDVEGAALTRRGGVITQMNTALKEIASWTFTRGWPCKWEIAEFDASKSELAIETLEIAHEGITWSKPGQKK